MHWQTKEQLTNLLVSLVQHGSVTLSGEEKRLASFIYYQLNHLDYFQNNPANAELHRMEDGRSFVTALVKQSEAADTIVLVSHFDVVGVEDYGVLKDLAFQPLELTRELENYIDVLPKEAKEHLESGDWLFGRGVMDMKAGLALQMSLLEKAIAEEWEVNLLLLAVPDEEVNSQGMLQALPALTELSRKHGLTYKACVNSEPMFQRYPGDNNLYLYTGAIGKLLPGFFCYGKETHVGEPLSGLNANLMISEIQRLMEWNTDLCEQVGKETTPPPTSLLTKDLKEEYSVQIPHTAVTLYNLLFMEKSLPEWETELLTIAKQAATNIDQFCKLKAHEYKQFASFNEVPVNVAVYTFEELKKKAEELYGKHELELRIASVIFAYSHLDEREQSIRVVEEIAALCKDLGPMIILFFAPPYYPAVATEDGALLESARSFIKRCQEGSGIHFLEQRYFSGLCDLSFIGKGDFSAKDRLPFNIPVYGATYALPFADMEALQMPVFNLGPVGKDPHQWTERLNVAFSFDTFPPLLADFVKNL
ncbi:succinyl-diaminopimelate desuccinylase [Bacillus sp. THAF10]|uniref:M20/M25/M40 family metallo-hydrolase n=1 Tax=Bacillus sp. THAF10 TaxID=2587848 RepID=UPI001267E74F|nr:M20/M25/M40 family metallo-hydrolase [Bacillus sp. THAF10]QFT89647.1 succinyl-diaminopimelate desuccinylase [Bacillus sp. THAF10]